MGGRLYLLVEGDVVQPHAQLPREEVGAVVTVPQEGPAERGAWPGVEGVPGAAQAQRRASSPQTLGAGVVVVQEAWVGGNSESTPWRPRGCSRPFSSHRTREAPPTLHGHGHVVKVVVVWLIPCLEVPLGNV